MKYRVVDDGSESVLTPLYLLSGRVVLMSGNSRRWYSDGLEEGKHFIRVRVSMYNEYDVIGGLFRCIGCVRRCV